MPVSLSHIIARLSDHKPRELEVDPSFRWAAVSAILRPRAHDWEILFIKRAAHDRDPWSGHMAFPGGQVDPIDPDAHAAALREVREEVGLDLTRSGRFLGQLNDVRATGRGIRLPMVVRPFVYSLQEEPELILNTDEVDEIVWIPLSSLLAGDGAGVFHYDYHGTPVALPCFRFASYLIWGLTHLMLSELLELVRPQLPDPDDRSSLNSGGGHEPE